MPAVVVCGKRSSSIFEDLHLHAPPPASKRARCASDAFLSTPALQRSPLADRGNGENSGEGTNLFAANLAHLRSLFPEMDQQKLPQSAVPPDSGQSVYQSADGLVRTSQYGRY
ncbi:hypothetical protein BHM03_00012114 [Ensete ventricosum]|nr:hypothetical protein BHM03_00012114 [Ensete ventricosum]